MQRLFNDPLQEAISALNQLTECYKDSVKVVSPWKRHTLWGGNTVGIQGQIILSSNSPEKHPFWVVLMEMGFSLLSYHGQFSKDDFKLEGDFELYDAKLLNEIPGKCYKITNTILPPRSGL